MSRDKGVVRALVRLREAGEPSVLAQREKALPAPCDYLVRIALVADVEDDAVARGVVDPVQRDGELYRAEIRREMAAGARNIVYKKCPYLRAERVKLVPAEFFYIVRCILKSIMF